MHSRTVFHLDCTPIISECGFECARCVQEIESALGRIEGVERVYLGAEQDEGKLFVEHDPNLVKVGQLIDVLKTLPSLYEEFFIPTVITA